MFSLMRWTFYGSKPSSSRSLGNFKVTGTLKLLVVPKLKLARYDMPVTNDKKLSTATGLYLQIPKALNNPLFDSYFHDTHSALNFFSIMVATRHSCSGPALTSMSTTFKDFESKIIWMVVPKYIKNATLGPIKIPKTVRVRKIDIELEEEGGEEDEYPVGGDYEDEEDEEGKQEEASAEEEEEAKTTVTAAQEDHPAVSPSSPEAPDSVKSAASLLACQFEFHLVVIPWMHVEDDMSPVAFDLSLYLFIYGLGPERFGLR
ncbi:hypothetical protein C8J56DRAFT_1067877 [Mycena floridula]|nr:hypothetical protein C8J56DRAFT_1067877 [Mycena floridula]